MVLIDTSAFIEFLNRTGSREDRLIENLLVNDEDVGFPRLALTEILQGIRNDEKHDEVKKSLLTFPAFSLKNSESYLAAAELYRACRKKGLTVRSTIDLLIAQIAIEQHAELLHRDADFDAIARISRLKIVK
ncbi:MAG: type II toxin-antitoxin system VapC family toxin [Nitrospirota bacterium]